MIRRWLERRADRRRERQFTAGYDHAAGALLRGTDLHELHADLDVFDDGPFEDGVREAMRDWIQCHAHSEIDTTALRSAHTFATCAQIEVLRNEVVAGMCNVAAAWARKDIHEVNGQEVRFQSALAQLVSAARGAPL